MLKTIAIALSLTALIATAEIYQWTDANGNTHYSDSAPKNKPQLAPKHITIPTAMPATKIQKRQESSGPQVIIIGGKDQGENCSAEHLNSTTHNAALDAWQESEWKACRRMK